MAMNKFGSAACVAVLLAFPAPSVGAQELALGGQVSSAQEGAMEGVLVSAQKAGSNITISVVSDGQGRFRFPAAKLAPGQYAVRIRAAGYETEGTPAVDLAPEKPVTLDLKLRRTSDLSAQLANAEWLASMPGTDAQKLTLLNCVGCHSLERVVKSRHTAEDFLTVTLPRMQGYVNQSIPAAPQLRKAERLMEERGDSRVQVYKRVADYLASINLSAGPEWSYELKTLPRPKGRATQVVYTEYDLPRETIQPHDVIVDAEGIVWHSSFGEQFLGRLDPKTGAYKEYPVPLHKPDFPTGFLGLRTDRDGNLWLGNMYQATIVKFDRKAEAFTYFPLTGEQNIDAAQTNMVAPQSSHVDGKVWSQNNGFAGVHRLDPATGQFETWEPFKNAPKGEPHNIYDIVPDSRNNAYFTDFRRHHIGRVDAKTGAIKIFEAPTPGSNPRRASMDNKDRMWFAEYRGDRIGMFDTKTEQFQEWKMPTKWSAPYDVMLDKHEEAWTGSMLTDRITRLDIKTGTTVEYLLPRQTNIRRVFVDSSTNPVTFWVGNNHGASIVKLEPLD